MVLSYYDVFKCSVWLLLLQCAVCSVQCLGAFASVCSVWLLLLQCAAHVVGCIPVRIKGNISRAMGEPSQS